MTSDSLSRRQIIFERFARNGFPRRFSSARECARSLVGIQYQVRSAGEMSLFFRVEGLRKSDLEEGYASGELINQWGQRKTLHLYDRSDYTRVCDVYHRYNYLIQLLKGREDEIEHIGNTISAIAPGTEIDRDVIWNMAAEHFPEGAKGDMYAPYAVYSWCSNNGLLYQAPGKQRTFVRSDIQWEYDSENTHESVKEMMRRYFRYFGPASRKDFCHMSGLTMSATDAAFEEMEEEMDVRYYMGKPMYSIGPAELRERYDPHVLLGKYDPLLLSYADKSWLAAKEDIPRIWKKAGRVDSCIVGPDGAFAVWNYSISGRWVDFTVEPFVKITDSGMRRITKDLKKLAVFMEKDVRNVSFSSSDD